MFLVMDKKILSRNPSECIILDNWGFDNLISVDELFAKLYEDLQLIY